MTCPEVPDTPHVTRATDRHVFHAPPLDTTPPTREQPAWNSSLTGLALCGFLTLGVYTLLAHRSSNAAPWFIEVAVLILFGLSLAVATLAWMASRLESKSSGSGAMHHPASQMILEDLRLIHPGTLHLGRPFTVALQARVPAGAPTVRAPHSVTFSILCSRTPLNGAGAAQRDSRIDRVWVPTPAGWQEASGSKHLHYEGTMGTPRTRRRFESEYWYVTLEDPYAPEDSPAVLMSELPRPAEPALRTPAWRPGRIEQLEALLHHGTHAVLSRAYPRPASDSPADRLTDHSPTEKERLAVFTVTFDELVDHAVNSDWLARHARHSSTMSDSLVYLLHDGSGYQVIHSERDSGQTLFTSHEPRAAVAYYLRHYGNLPPMAGLEATPRQ